jgi:hypothetical protein
LLDTVNLGAAGSSAAFYDSGGIGFTNGIFVDVVSGAVEGSIRIG